MILNQGKITYNQNYFNSNTNHFKDNTNYNSILFQNEYNDNINKKSQVIKIK